MATQLGQGIPKGCPILSLSFSQEEMPRKLWTFPQLPCPQERMGMQCGRVSTLQNSVGRTVPRRTCGGGRAPHLTIIWNSDSQTDIMGDLPMKTPAHQDSVKQLLKLCDGSSRFPPGS